MGRIRIACIYLFLSLSLAFAKETPQSPQTTPAGGADHLQIESALQRYLGAYVHRSLPELLAIWPDLLNQKKEYERIKRHLSDPTVSGEQMTVQPLEIQPTDDGALVRAQRTEQFVKTETATTIATGDMRREVGQEPDPHQSERKKEVKKSGEVWITMRRVRDTWTIVSVSDKKPK